MVAVDLLAEARAAGLVVHMDGERLILRGPKTAGDLAGRMLASKADVLVALRAELVTPLETPSDPIPPAETQPSPPAVVELTLWALVDRVDADGCSLGQQPTCIQALASSREDRSAWAQLGDGSWWRAANLRRVSDDGRNGER